MFIFEKSYIHFNLLDGHFLMELCVPPFSGRFYLLAFLPSVTTMSYVLFFHSSGIPQVPGAQGPVMPLIKCNTQVSRLELLLSLAPVLKHYMDIAEQSLRQIYAYLSLWAISQDDKEVKRNQEKIELIIFHPY